MRTLSLALLLAAADAPGRAQDEAALEQALAGASAAAQARTAARRPPETRAEIESALSRLGFKKGHPKERNAMFCEWRALQPQRGYDLSLCIAVFPGKPETPTRLIPSLVLSAPGDSNRIHALVYSHDPEPDPAGLFALLDPNGTRQRVDLRRALRKLPGYEEFAADWERRYAAEEPFYEQLRAELLGAGFAETPNQYGDPIFAEQYLWYAKFLLAGPGDAIEVHVGDAVKGSRMIGYRVFDATRPYGAVSTERWFSRLSMLRRDAEWHHFATELSRVARSRRKP